MTKIEFSKDEQKNIVNKIKLYFSEELDQEIGEFDATFLLEFFSKEIGTYFYNQGLYDAQSILANRLDSINDAILDLRKTIRV